MSNLENIFMVLHLNMRLQPMHRHEIEDMICDTMTEHHGEDWGDVVGGGTLMDDETGTALSCESEYSINPEFVNQFLHVLDFSAGFNFFAKGSSLTIFNADQTVKETKAIGNAEGLAITLSNDLPDNVYAENDINVLIEKLQQAVGEHGNFTSWSETATTSLYFYGNSFEELKRLMSAVLDSHPLAQNAIIEQIA